jgi:DNA-directed RNA polymerase beta subunit
MLNVFNKKQYNVFSNGCTPTITTPKLFLSHSVFTLRNERVFLTSKLNYKPKFKFWSFKLYNLNPCSCRGVPSHTIAANTNLHSTLNINQCLYNFKTKLKKGNSNLSFKLIQEIIENPCLSKTYHFPVTSFLITKALRPYGYNTPIGFLPTSNNFFSPCFYPLYSEPFVPPFVPQGINRVKESPSLFGFKKNGEERNATLESKDKRKTIIPKKNTTIEKIPMSRMNYMLETYHRSNQDTCLIQKPAVNEGDWVQIGDLLADSASSVGGELAIGHNILVAYMPWEGYNYEDAILINERLVYEDIYTSIHIERYEIQTMETKLGSEKITKELPDKNEKEISHLDKNGIAKIGSWVEEGDILVGKIAPKDIKQLTPQQKLLYKIFEKKLSNTKDTSLRAPKGIHANVINVNILAMQKNIDTKTLSSTFKSSKKTALRPLGYRQLKSFSQPGTSSFSPSYFPPAYLGVKKLKNKNKITIYNQRNIKEHLFQKKHNIKPRWPWQTTILEKTGFAYKIIGSPLSSSSIFLKLASVGPGNQKKVTKNNKLKFKTHKKDLDYKSNTLSVPRDFIFKKTKNINRLRHSDPFPFIPRVKVLQGNNDLLDHFFRNSSKKMLWRSIRGRARLNQQVKFTLKKKISQKQKIFAKNFKKFLYVFKKSKRVLLPQVHFKNIFDKKLELISIDKKEKFNNLLKYVKIKKRINKKVSNFFLHNRKIVGSPTSVHIYLAEKRKIVVGDKMAGRHGNKGIVSRILPRQDMPFLPDGSSIDIVLNPLGVPSRMNVGQIYECLLGLAGRYLGEHYKIPPFDEVYGADASRSFVLSKLYNARKQTGLKWLFDPNNPGKMRVFDGRNSQSFHQTVTVGVAYVLKLVHMVDDKLHARSVGPYSLVTQQPLRGRSKQGGQRLGEMEVWAIEGYGAAFVLSEMLTLKSDDMTGRQNLWKNLIEHNSISLGSPESFKVLVCELQALCLDIGLFKKTLNKTFLEESTLQKTFKEIPTLIEIDSLLHLA